MVHIWTNDQFKYLLDVCIEEVNTVGRRGCSMRKESWDKLGVVLKERFGMSMNQKQLKNAYDGLKAKYVGWTYLKNKTGNLYNEESNTFTLTEEEWEEFRKGHPKAISLKTHPMPFPNLCAALFDGSAATGNIAWTSTQTVSLDEASSYQQTEPIDNNPFDGIGVDEDLQTGDSDPVNLEQPSNSSADTMPPRKKTKVHSRVELLMEKAVEHFIKESDGPTMDECYEKLQLIGLDPEDRLFLGAFSIFGRSKAMREAWMKLPPIPNVLKGWIKMNATALGIFSSGE